MVRNYLKVALRGLLKNRLYSFINIMGLALGMTGCLLITTHIWDEITFDGFHTNGQNIYQVNRFFNKIGLASYTSPPLASTIIEYLPEVKNATRLYVQNGNIQINTEAYSESISYVDPSFFHLFSFPLLEGEPNRILNQHNEVLITKNLSRKYFGDSSALGKTLKITAGSWSKAYDFTIVGVLDNIPSNSSLRLEVVLPISFLEKIDYSYQNGGNWRAISTNTFIQLNQGVDIAKLENKIDKLVKEIYQAKYRYNRKYSLLSLSDIHFSDIKQNIIVTSDKTYVYILSCLALIIIVIASINSTSLSIGHSTKRKKEIGLRKAIGASKKQLIWQFLCEYTLIVATAFLISLILFTLLLPVFNTIIGKQLSLYVLAKPEFILIIIVFLMTTILLSSSYPIVVLIKFSPNTNLRNRLSFFGSKQLVASLSTLQFIASSFLIITTFLIDKQLETVFSKNLGFDDDLVIKLEVPYKRGGQLLEQYRNLLSEETRVLSVSGSWNKISSTTGTDYNNYEFIVKGEKINGKALTVDHKLMNTLQVKLKKGRHLTPKDTTRHYRKVIVNEHFVREAEITNPIGTVIEFPEGVFLLDMFLQAEIVGVVEDFHYESLHKAISPLVITSHRDRIFSSLYVRLSPGNLMENIDLLEDKWNLIASDLPFTYTFMEEVVAAQYDAETKWLDIGFYASCLAISIACMGMFGLTVLSTSQRVKEIGIRKILGASISSILLLLSREYLKIVLFAYIIAIPIANYAISLWLEGFAYKIEITWWHFLITGIIMLLITILTVSGQSIKSATRNPVDCLRNE